MLEKNEFGTPNGLLNAGVSLMENRMWYWNVQRAKTERQIQESSCLIYWNKMYCSLFSSTLIFKIMAGLRNCQENTILL